MLLAVAADRDENSGVGRLGAGRVHCLSTPHAHAGAPRLGTAPPPEHAWQVRRPPRVSEHRRGACRDVAVPRSPHPQRNLGSHPPSSADRTGRLPHRRNPAACPVVSMRALVWCKRHILPASTARLAVAIRIPVEVVMGLPEHEGAVRYKPACPSLKSLGPLGRALVVEKGLGSRPRYGRGSALCVNESD